MKEVNNMTEPEKTEDLIIKYLTDCLNESELELFRKLISTDQSFRKELSLSIAAMAISDSVLGTLI